MKHLHFLRSLAIWLFIFLPMVFLGFFVVAWKLTFFAENYSGPWGNRKYPDVWALQQWAKDNASKGVKMESWLDFWMFWAVRNPVSNFSHDQLAIYPPPYEYTDYRIFGIITVNHGYKASGTFKFRPRITKD